MRALTWQGNLDVPVTDVPDPGILEPDDTVIQADGCINVVLRP